MAGEPGLSELHERTESIRWIAFDAVGTLIFPVPPVWAVYHRVARSHGSRQSETEIGQRFRDTFRECEEDDLGKSTDWTRPDRLTADEGREQHRWRRIVANVINDVDDPESCFVELFDYFAGPSAWKCFPEVDEVLKTLHRARYRLSVASNFDSRLDALCDGLPELGPIELRVISSQVGYRKPSLHFYRALAAAADCQPAEILMVGNDFQNDILGAQQAGLQTLFVQRNSPAAASGQIANLRQLVDLLGSR